VSALLRDPAPAGPLVSVPWFSLASPVFWFVFFVALVVGAVVVWLLTEGDR
jgi:hypothetical protein